MGDPNKNRCGYSIILPPVEKYPSIMRAQKRINDKPKNLEASNPFLKSRFIPNIPTRVDMTKLYRSSTIVSTDIDVIRVAKIKYTRLVRINKKPLRKNHKGFINSVF
jgi:hypothetical protein